MKKYFKKIIPISLKIFIKDLLNKNSIMEISKFESYDTDRSINLLAITNNLRINAIDIGGANGVQPHWNRMLNVINLLIFEPHPASFLELKKLYEKNINSGEFKIMQKGVSSKGGQQTLYCTNVPTGSSLLEPDLGIDYVSKSSYFNPIKKIQIDTISIDSAIEAENFPMPDIIKLDLQGLEYEILNSLSLKTIENLVCIEVEINFTKAYKNQKNFSDYLTFMETKGFELLDFRTNRSNLGDIEIFNKVIGNLTNYDPSCAQRLHEVDAVFIKKSNTLIERREITKIRKLISILCVYNFYFEALNILKLSHETNLIDNNEFKYIKTNVSEIHKKMKFELEYEAQLISKKNGMIWAQYMHVPYPSF